MICFTFQLNLFSMRKQTSNDSYVWYGYCMSLLETLADTLDFRFVAFRSMKKNQKPH